MRKSLSSNSSSKQDSKIQVELLPHFYKHDLDKHVFQRKWKAFLWLALLPSFGLDLLAIAAYGYDVVKGNIVVQQMLISSVSFIAINAIVVKGLTIYYFYRFREIRERSHILTDDAAIHYICYSMRVASDATDAVSAYYYKEYMVEEVEALTKRKDGTILVQGTIRVIKHSKDLEDKEETYGVVKRRKKIKIPAYYSDMTKIYEVLCEIKCLKGNTN